jgi:tetratricopeptide (TPR) repeat protein
MRTPILALALTCFVAGRALADSPADADALRAYDEGTKYYTIGEFEKAIAAYKHSWELRPDPVLLYNIGQAYRLEGDYPKALFFYRSYLRNMPAASNREQVEKRITELDETVAKQKTAEAPPNEAVDPARKAVEAPPVVRAPVIAPSREPPKPPSPAEVARLSAAGLELERMSAPPDRPRTHPVYKRWWFWAGIGAVAAGAAAIAIVARPGSGAPSTHFGAVSF